MKQWKTQSIWKKIYESTDDAGFRVLTWYNAGTKKFYATKPIYEPGDLKGFEDSCAAKSGQCFYDAGIWSGSFSYELW